MLVWTRKSPLNLRRYREKDFDNEGNVMTQSLPFIHFAGGAWLHGKDVAVHGDNEIRELRAETCGGKKVPGSREVVITVEEYEALREQWTQGGQIGRGDAKLAYAALAYLGVTA